MFKSPILERPVQHLKGSPVLVTLSVLIESDIPVVSFRVSPDEHLLIVPKKECCHLDFLITIPH